MKTFSKILLLFLSLSSVLSNLRTLEDLKVTKKTILVKPNQIFTIKLYTNPSTHIPGKWKTKTHPLLPSFKEKEK